MQMEIATTPLVVTSKAQKDGIVVRLQRAREALVDADIPTTKEIADAAEAAEVYAKRRDLGEEVELMARSIKMDALRRLGQLLAQIPRNRGGSPGSVMDKETPKLKELGIDSRTSMLAQKIAALPEGIFDRVRIGDVSVSAAIGAARRQTRQSIMRPVGAKRLGSWPLPSGVVLAEAERDEIRAASEAIYDQAQTMAIEARWLALVASELKAGEKTKNVMGDRRLDELMVAARKRFWRGCGSDEG
jgi:hypothetical protein